MQTGMSKKEHALSKRMCGVGIILCGLLLLSVALIMGLDFPEYVYEKNLKDLCILNASHRLYQQWVNDTFRDKFNRIYYWEIKNPEEFLYGGAFPKLVERGPYMYREYERKQEVRFIYNKVQFYLRRWQVFDQARTRRECGTNCSEDDLITILNPSYFQMIGPYGDMNYALQHVPSMITSIISEASRRTDYQGIMTQMGRFSSRNLDNLVTGDLAYPKNFTNLGFGSWVNLQDSPFKRTVMQHRDQSDFTSKEMAGLFQVIGDQQLFGTPGDMTPPSSTLADCDLNPQTFKFFPNQDNQQRGTLRYDTKGTACTFLACLYRYMEYHTTSTNFGRYLNNVTDCIQRYLCLSNATACLVLPLNPYVQNAYILTINDYVHTHLTQYAFYKEVITKGEDLIVTKRQFQFALGLDYFNGTRIETDAKSLSYKSAILEHAPREKDIYQKSKHISLYNCYDDMECRTNFDWKSYNGAEFIPEQFFLNTTREDRKVNSFWRNLVPVKNIIACQDTMLSDQEYTFFIPEFWRKLVFRPQQLDYLSNGVTTPIQVKQSMFTDVDGVFVQEEGLQTMEGVFGYRSWFSLPHFLYAGNIAQLYDMTPKESQHIIQMGVEPVTGTVWDADIRYQLNIGILPTYVSTQRPRPLILNSTDYPIPVYWIHKSFTYNDEGKAEFQDRTRRLLQAACGGLIGMSVISCLTIIIGILAATITVKSNRVAPVENPDVGY